MGAQLSRGELSRRDELIALARYGKITPAEAEAEAVAAGLAPFAQQPALPDFDPMLEPRWPIVMAVAWIAWRDLTIVRENCSRFRSESVHWVFREWNEPINDGSAFAGQKGWFLERWSEPTTVRLSIVEKLRNGLPASWCMSVLAAEKALWRALSDGHLVAEALSRDGKPVDIPQREWSYLKLFEDGKRDVLRYEVLDRDEPFTEVKLKRDDLLRLWPDRTQREAIPLGVVEPFMLEPMTSPMPAGYVPLCVVLHWIMTSGSTRSVAMGDEDAWAASVEKLFPLIFAGDIELIGLPCGQPLTERVPGHALTLVNVLPPFHDQLAAILLNSPSHIDCSPYLDQEHWTRGSNDKLYMSGRGSAAWTHLQVKKADVLSRWPKPEPTVKSARDVYRWLLDQMQQSPTIKTRSKAAIWAEAKQKFRPLSERQFNRAWDGAITESGAHIWAKAGRPSSNPRTK
jgi:hypothetical protein